MSFGRAGRGGRRGISRHGSWSGAHRHQKTRPGPAPPAHYLPKLNGIGLEQHGYRIYALRLGTGGAGVTEVHSRGRDHRLGGIASDRPVCGCSRARGGAMLGGMMTYYRAWR